MLQCGGESTGEMDVFHIFYYTKKNGSSPVSDFLNRLPRKMLAKVVRDLELLSCYGNELKEPYTKSIDAGIFELRTRLADNQVRILYFFIDQHRIILTNGFIKKTQKTPRIEIELAKKYRNDYLSRSTHGET